jgi:plastocyanin
VWAGPANGGAKGVLVWTTTDAYVKVGEAVTATSASTPIPAYTMVTLAVPMSAKTFVVSAIQISAGGTVYAKPVGGS